MSFKKQTISYIGIGVILWLIDWGVMVLLSNHGMNVELANVLGRVAGAIVGFVLNGFVTFRADHTKVGRKQFLRFLFVWIFTTIISTLFIHWIDDRWGLLAAQWLKPVVEFATGVIGFLASRYWIYHK